MPNAGLYEECTIQTSYPFSPGLLQMPVAGPPGTPCSIVRVHAPMSMKSVSWVARKVGSKPRLPHPEPQATNDVLANGIIKGACPAHGIDNESECQIEGQYSYFLRLPVWIHDQLPLGKQQTDLSSGHFITIEDFDKSLLAASNVAPKGEQANDLGLGTFIVR